MEQKQFICPEESVVDQVEASHQRPPMKYFRKTNRIQSIQGQRIKRQSLDRIQFKYTEDLKKVVELMRHQKSSIKTLKKIHIDYTEKSLPSQFISFVSQIRKCICQLKYLKLGFPSDLKDECLVSLKKIGNCKQLQHLDLKLDYCDNLTNKGVKTFATQVCKNHPSLLRLSLYVNIEKKLQDESISAVATNIGRRLHKLQQLKIYWESNISDQGALVLAEQIGKNMKNLIQLDITLKSCQLSDQTIQAFANQCQNLTKLKQLILSFSESMKDITDQGFLALASCIGNDLQQLLELSLDFSFCSKITDKSALAFATQIGNLQALVGLSLNFSYCPNVMNALVPTMAELLKYKLQKVQRLTLGFYL